MKEKFKNAKEKVKEFIRENKVELLIGAAGTLVTAVSLALIGKQIDVYRELDEHYYPCEIDLDRFVDDPVYKNNSGPYDIGVGNMTYLNTRKNGIREFWVEDMSVNDMGNLGEKIKEHFPDVSEDKNVWALLSISDKKENEDQ